jgi:hypothetical protein
MGVFFVGYAKSCLAINLRKVFLYIDKIILLCYNRGMENLILKISNSVETYMVDSDGVKIPFTRGMANRLFENLRLWRIQIARENKIAPYTILDDKTLNAIVDIIPYKKNMLWLVKGMGAQKILQYGDDIVSIINNFINEYHAIDILYGNLAIDISTDRVEGILGFIGLLEYFGGHRKRDKKTNEKPIDVVIPVDAISSTAVTRTDFVSRFGLNTAESRKVNAAIGNWLFDCGFIEDNISQGGKVSKVASVKGKQAGLINDQQRNAAGYTYLVVLLGEQIQKEIASNIEYIMQPKTHEIA